MTTAPGTRGTKRERNRKDRLLDRMKDDLKMSVRHERKAYALQKRVNYTKGSRKLFRDQKEAFISKYISQDDKIRYDNQTCTVLRVFKRSLKIKLEFPYDHFVHGKTSEITIEKYTAWLPKEKLKEISDSLHSKYSFMNLSNNEYETVRLIPNGSELTFYEAVILTFPTLINGLSKLWFEFLKENEDLIVIFRNRKKYEIINDNQAIQKLQEYEEQFNLTDIQTLIKQKEEMVFSQKISSFFPTPHNLIKKMIGLLDVKPNQTILETSAGNGFIVDQLKALDVDLDIDCCEINYLLREILLLKDHNIVSDDFLEFNPSKKYDRIIQNPPFENYQDIDFIYRAYDLLKRDGILISIVMESRLNPNSTRKTVQQFNNWLQGISSFSFIDTPNKIFTCSERSTQTGAKMIVINK